MTKGRMEAFSDGVLAIVITIMVLEMKPPHEPTLEALRSVGPVFVSYALSFLYLAIYWNNHHHLLQNAKHVSAGILWANMHLLFWLSLIPFANAWYSEAGMAAWPVAAYGVVLLGAGVAYQVLTRQLVGKHGQDSGLARALGKDAKGKLSLVLYAAAIVTAFVAPLAAYAVYMGVALMWLVPDRRLEQA